MIALLAASALAAAAPLAFYTAGIKPWPPIQPTDLAPRAELSGARGETLTLTVRIEPGTPCFEPALDLKVSRPRATFYEVLPFTTEHPSYAGAKPGPYLDPIVPRQRFCAAKAAPLWMLVEVPIPRDAKRGTYAGSLKAGATQLPIQLKIWGFELPEQPTLPMTAELTTWFVLLGHYGKWHEGEAKLSAKYIEQMLANRMVPTKHWVRDFTLGPELAELKTIDGKPSPDSFDAAVVRPLPATAGVPVPFTQDLDPDKPETAAKISKVYKAIQKAGLLPRAYAYLWDEPKPTDLPALKKLARLVRKQAPELKILITTMPPKDLSDELYSLIDIWVPIVDELPKITPSALQKLRSQGKKLWTYASCVSHGCYNLVDSGAPDWMIDRSGPYIRVQGWLARKYGLDGLLYYSVNNGYQTKGRDLWADLWDFSGNGDGTLFYPGRPGLHGLKEHTPIESLRLKLWRQSSYDADYIYLIEKNPPTWWKGQIDKLVRSVSDWEKSDRPYRELRERIGDTLDGGPTK